MMKTLLCGHIQLARTELCKKLLQSFYVLSLLFVSVQTLAQTGTVVRGTVSDDKGVTLPGASVTVKDTRTSVVTDDNGKFMISVPGKQSVLVISYLTFKKQEITVGDQTSLTVRLQTDDNQLEEVVVVGYGTQKKVTLTGSVDQVSAKQLDDRPITRLSQALQGMMGGLNVLTTTSGGAPNGVPSLNIRGFTGLGVNAGPLVVIDGVQGGDINSINANDVESITMLKDAASSAIYGSSAPYGVLLITTKRGKSGTPSISYNNNFTVAQPINLPEMMNSLDFANIYNEAFANASRGIAFTDATIQRIKDYQAGIITTETVKAPTGDNWDTYFGGNSNNDFFKLYFKDNVFNQQHNLSVSGGGNSSDYYIGLGYNDRSGMYNFGKDVYDRYNVRTTFNSAVNQWLSFSIRGSLAKSKYETPNTYGNRTGGNYMHQIGRKFPTVPIYNPDGLLNESNDILLHENGGRNIDNRNDIVTTGEIKLDPVKGWNVTANYTFDGVYTDQSAHTKTVNHTLPSGVLSPISGTSPNGFSRTDTRNEHHVVNVYSSYEKQLSKHYLRLMGGYVNELTRFTSFGGSNNNLYSDDIPSLALTYGLSPSATDFARELAIEGFFSRFNYVFDDKYMLELNGRYDGSSRFLSDVRWSFYPGASAGWNLHKEGFWQKLKVDKVVNTFKLSANYGSQADQGYLDAGGANWYPFYPSLGATRPTGSNWFFGTQREAAISRPPLVNPDLTWVTTTSYGVRSEATFLRDRLSSTFDWFVRKQDDLAGPAAVLPAVIGIGVPSANNTRMETKGFELSLQWRDRIGNWTYGVRGTLADYTSKIIDYPGNPTGLLSNWYNGEVQGSIYGYVSNGLYKTSAEAAKGLPAAQITNQPWRTGDVIYEDLNGDGAINIGKNTFMDMGDRKVIGNNTPRYQYGFNLDLGWKAFDFSAFLQGIGKRDAWMGSNYFWGIVGDEWQSSPFTVHADRWSETNPDGYFPRFYMNGWNSKNTQVSTRYLQNAAYMRIKNVQLGYSLPEKIASRAFMKRARLYLSVENLATFTKLIKTMDPELSIGDAKIYPLQRNYSFGVNISL